MVVIGGSGGSEPTYVARALAEEGVAALSLAYFGRPGLPTNLSAINLEYFKAALDVLAEHLDPGAPLALIGLSRGSEAAMLTAVHLGDGVRGVLVSVPASVVVGGLPSGGPAWLLRGKPLPWVEHAGPDCEDPAAVIPVERVLGPIMLVSAGRDGVWPSAPMARAISERLADHGHAYGHVLLEYADAGHALGYLVPDLPEGLLPPGVPDDFATRNARLDAWPRVIEFLRHRVI